MEYGQAILRDAIKKPMGNGILADQVPDTYPLHCHAPLPLAPSLIKAFDTQNNYTTLFIWQH
jgi:hypothetical protein